MAMTKGFCNGSLGEQKKKGRKTVWQWVFVNLSVRKNVTLKDNLHFWAKKKSDYITLLKSFCLAKDGGFFGSCSYF